VQNRSTMKSMTGVVGALIATLMLVLGTVSTANAATSAVSLQPNLAPIAINAGPTVQHEQLSIAASAPSASPGHAAPAATITCTPQVQNPHNSSHVNGTVNVVVTLKCTSVVPQINIRAALYFNGNLVKDSGQRTVNNSSSAQNNAAVPCKNGTYQGWMSYGVLFPPGFVPPTGAGSGFGNAVSITC
jgi:hypothetical protein